MKSTELSSYSPLNFALSVKIMLRFNVLYCLFMFFTNYFEHFERAYLKSERYYSVKSSANYFMW